LASFSLEQAQVDGAYNIVTNAIAQTSAKHSSMDDESKYYAAKAECLLIELRLLSAALDARLVQVSDITFLIYVLGTFYHYIDSFKHLILISLQ